MDNASAIGSLDTSACRSQATSERRTGHVDLWVTGKEVVRFTFRISLRQSSRAGPLERHLDALSADILLTLNVRGGPVVTHEPGFDLRFSL
jgi:hypothetical protein